MKKNRMLIAALAMTALLLAGCGAARDEGKETAPEAAVERAEDADIEPAAEESTVDTDGTASAEETPETPEEKKPVTMAELMGEGRKEQQGEIEELPQTVLWFNATYAPLTYSNGWNWRMLGGMEPTEENRDLSRQLLERSWSVKDRESALDTTTRLLKDGHRKKCLDYTKQMEEWGILDLGEEKFVQQILEKDLEDEVGRYAVAYLMHQMKIEPEYIAAWDLCRVNQLYADYYFCGYMSYEEAMDASLANSLNLQKLYGSWEEMVEAYLLGYQFWQGDVKGFDYGYDSPTQERRHYCEMLQELEDGPYTLDWNMELKKSW